MTDFEGEIYTAVANAAANDALFKASIRRFVRYDGAAPVRITNPQPADLGEFDLDYESGVRSLYGTDDETYDFNADFDTGAEAWVETGSLTLVARLTFDTLNLSPAHRAVRLFLAVLRRMGPTLGRTDVARWGPVDRRDERNDTGQGDARGRMWRRTITLRIPIYIEAQGHDQLS